MSEMFSPQQACAIATEATGYAVDSRMLRTWRNRGLVLTFEQEGEGWTRYGIKDVFSIAVMCHVLRAGYTVRTAASVARTARDYSPGVDGSNAPKMHLVFPGITADDGEGDAIFLHRFHMHQNELPKLFTEETQAKYGDCLWIIFPLSNVRERVLEEVAVINGLQATRTRNAVAASPIDTAAIYDRLNAKPKGNAG